MGINKRTPILHLLALHSLHQSPLGGFEDSAGQSFSVLSATTMGCNGAAGFSLAFAGGGHGSGYLSGPITVWMLWMQLIKMNSDFLMSYMQELLL